MTVEYVSQYSLRGIKEHFNVLFRWRGSMYKMVWQSVGIFVFFQLLQRVVYSILPWDYKESLDDWAAYCEASTAYVSYGAAISFFVSSVHVRFWDQFNSIPWPYDLAQLLVCYVRPVSEGTEDMRLIRRTVVRYSVLGLVITLRYLSPQVQKRFPTNAHLVHSGLISQEEMDEFDAVICRDYKYFTPFVWACNVVSKAKTNGNIKSELAYERLLNEILNLRGKCGTLVCYDWIPIPLVYTQIIIILVYVYSLATMMGQPLGADDGSKDLRYDVPIFAIFQFIIYYVWLKILGLNSWIKRVKVRGIMLIVGFQIAVMMMNPLGFDDDDFDLNNLIDRQLEEMYLIVDHIPENAPEVMADMHWGQTEVIIPYTKETLKFKKEAFFGSALPDTIPEKMQEVVIADKKGSKPDKKSQ